MHTQQWYRDRTILADSYDAALALARQASQKDPRDHASHFLEKHVGKAFVLLDTTSDSRNFGSYYVTHLGFNGYGAHRVVATFYRGKQLEGPDTEPAPAEPMASVHPLILPKPPRLPSPEIPPPPPARLPVVAVSPSVPLVGRLTWRLVVSALALSFTLGWLLGRS